MGHSSHVNTAALTPPFSPPPPKAAGTEAPSEAPNRSAARHDARLFGSKRTKDLRGALRITAAETHGGSRAEEGDWLPAAASRLLSPPAGGGLPSPTRQAQHVSLSLRSPRRPPSSLEETPHPAAPCRWGGREDPLPPGPRKGPLPSDYGVGEWKDQAHTAPEDAARSPGPTLRCGLSSGLTWGEGPPISSLLTCTWSAILLHSCSALPLRLLPPAPTTQPRLLRLRTQAGRLTHSA